MSKKQFRVLKKLVSTENKDRNRIYAMITKQNNFDEREQVNLRLQMFKTRLNLDPVGTYYHEKGYWLKK